MKQIRLIAIALILTSCTGYPRILDFPVDPGGRGLNSPASELTPQVTQKSTGVSSGNRFEQARYIVFASDRNGSQDIYLYDLSRRRLIDLPGLNAFNEIAAHPSLSEDGRYLVFVASLRGQSDIMLYDRQTQQKRNLTANLQAEVRHSTISADGSTIAFEAATDGQWQVVVYSRSGERLY